jgi:hypothetical protein
MRSENVKGKDREAIFLVNRINPLQPMKFNKKIGRDL